jgi:hypothetical protein
LDDLTSRLSHCETYCRIETRRAPVQPDPKTIVKFGEITASQDKEEAELPALSKK